MWISLNFSQSNFLLNVFILFDYVAEINNSMILLKFKSFLPQLSFSVMIRNKRVRESWC